MLRSDINLQWGGCEVSAFWQPLLLQLSERNDFHKHGMGIGFSLQDNSYYRSGKSHYRRVPVSSKPWTLSELAGLGTDVGSLLGT